MTRKNRECVDERKSQYTPGTRVRLVRMDDKKSPPVGAEGTVTLVDDIGTIHIEWDNGSSLGVVMGADLCEIIK